MKTEPFQLKEIRKRKQITLRELSIRTGLSNGYLSQLENGNRKPKPETIRKLSLGLYEPYEKLLLKFSYLDNPFDDNILLKEIDRLKIENIELKDKLKSIKEILKNL